MKPKEFDRLLSAAGQAIDTLKMSLEDAPRAPLTGDLFIFINQTTFNVSEFYRRAGFEALPPTPTMSGAQIQAAAEADSSYGVFCQDAWNEYWHDRQISGHEAVPLMNGMRFYTIPPCYGSGVYPEDIEDQKPFDWQQIHERYQRRDYSCKPWGSAPSKTNTVCT